MYIYIYTQYYMICTWCTSLGLSLLGSCKISSDFKETFNYNFESSHFTRCKQEKQSMNHSSALCTKKFLVFPEGCTQLVALLATVPALQFPRCFF